MLFHKILCQFLLKLLLDTNPDSVNTESWTLHDGLRMTVGMGCKSTCRDDALEVVDLIKKKKNQYIESL